MRSIFFFVVIFVCGFTVYRPSVNPVQWSQQVLSESFDARAENIKLKKWDLNITNSGFFRFRKYYQNGKQEYYSFSLKRFSDMEYLGTTSSGLLLLKTERPDIIFQTYNDPKGNIDSMSNVIKLQLKNMATTRLDSLYHIFLELKKDQ